MNPHAIDTSKEETFKVAGKVFDVTKAKELVAGRTPNYSLPVAQCRCLFKDTDIQRRRAMNDSVNVDVPVIVATMRDDDGLFHFCIDGWHRIYKAHRKGLKTVPAHKLTLKETEGIIK